MRTTVFAVLTTILWGSVCFAQNTPPLSAIDWLSDSVNLPSDTVTGPVGPSTATSASVPGVAVTPLDQPSPNSIGILPSSLTKLPTDLWARSEEQDLIDRLNQLSIPKLPVLRDLLATLMLAQAEAPLGSTTNGRLFLARVDRLLAIGRLQEAQSLLLAAEPDTPEIFRRFFDVTLLTGTEDAACQIMTERPDIAPTFPARIFCLARSGDWTAAALTLNTHRALGDISDEEELLLSLFLDPEVAELQVDISTPTRVTPLVFRMREAIGETLATSDLPLAFAHADLRDTSGWKAQLEAAERLARYDALDPNVFSDLFTSRRPSASGGIWDHVAAVQDLDQALRTRDSRNGSQLLETAWRAMQTSKTEMTFALLYGDQLGNIEISGDAVRFSDFVHFLTANDGDNVVIGNSDPFLTALAQGQPQEIRTTDPTRLAIQSAFNGAPAPPALMQLVNNKQMGAALLEALSIADGGLDGDQSALRDTISFFRAIGFETTARQIALQHLILGAS